LRGNTSEWTLDWYAPYPTPCSDCATFAPPPSDGAAVSKVARGGAEDDEFDISERLNYAATPGYFEVGARCARLP
jgi:formylglycine-generating enzyme required for sulfatase activity